MTLYRRVHEMQPSNAEALATLGSTLMQVNANTEAVKAYRLAVAARPRIPKPTAASRSPSFPSTSPSRRWSS